MTKPLRVHSIIRDPDCISEVVLVLSREPSDAELLMLEVAAGDAAISADPGEDEAA